MLTWAFNPSSGAMEVQPAFCRIQILAPVALVIVEGCGCLQVCPQPSSIERDLQAQDRYTPSTMLWIVAVQFTVQYSVRQRTCISLCACTDTAPAKSPCAEIRVCKPKTGKYNGVCGLLLTSHSTIQRLAESACMHRYSPCQNHLWRHHDLMLT